MDNRKKLLELVEKGNIPMPLDEAKKHLENLSDEEVGLLVSTYGDLENAENAIEEVVKEVEPKQYKKAKDEYDEGLKLDREEYENELQKIDGEVAAEKDKFEDEVLKESKKAVGEMNDEINKTEDAREEIIKISESSLQ